MKGKWTKILLIINMFLCLFGVQCFSNSNYESVSAMPNTIYAEINGASWTTVKMHAWDSNGSADYTGIKVTNAGGKTNLYKFTGVNTAYQSLLFYNGSWGGANQTADYNTVSNNNYFIVGPNKTSEGKFAYGGAYSGVSFFTQNNVYFDLRDSNVNWGSNTNIYLWKDSTEINNSWPGVKVTSLPTVSTIENSLYKVSTFTGPFTHILIDNGSSQTDNFKLSELGSNNCYKVVKDSSATNGYKIIAKKLFKVSANDTTTTKTHYVSLLSDIPTPSKPNYTFKGWFTSLTGGTQVTSLSSDCTIYAQFEHSNCNLTISDNGSNIIKSVKYNSTIQSLIDNGTLSSKGKTGYTFSHWSLSDNGTKMDYSTTVTTDMKVYAVYTINQYTVSFVSNEETISSKVYNYGQTIEVPENPTKPSTADKVYTFDKWIGSDSSTLTGGQTITATKNITYTAHFTDSARTYDIIYHYNGTSKTINLAYGSGIIANAPADAKINGKKISWYFDETFTIPVTGDSVVDSQRSVYAKYVDLTYASVYIDYSEFTTWSYAVSHFYVYSSTSDVNNTWPGKTASTFDCGSITSLGNNIYQIKLDETYDNIIINNGVSVNGKQIVDISLAPNANGERIKYVKLTDSTRKGTIEDGESVVGRDLNLIKTETNLDNLLKTQKAPISGTDDMYRFTFGVNDTNKYGLSFIFITSDNKSTIRYWNFSTDSKLNEVRLGTTLYDKTKGYSGYYSLTIKENGSFNLLNYDRFVVLACYKDSTGVNVLKAVEYKINTDGSLTRVV